MSSNNHTVSEDRELDENIYSNDSYTESASLLEQVLFCCAWCAYLIITNQDFIHVCFTGDETWTFRPIWLEIC